MDIFPLIIFLGVGWVIYSNVKAANKGLNKVGKTNARDEFETRVKAKAKDDLMRLKAIVSRLKIHLLVSVLAPLREDVSV